MTLSTIANQFSLLAQAAKFGGGLQPVSSPFAVSTTDTSGRQAVSMFEKIFSNVLGILTIIAGLYFILTFIVAAFNWLSAGGDTGKVKKARDSIVNALLGLIIVVAAYGVIGIIGGLVGLDLLRPGKMILELKP